MRKMPCRTPINAVIRCSEGRFEGRGGLSSILIVEGDSEAAGYVSGLLRDLGLEAESAPTGERALAVARRERPRLVLVEVRLPGVSGYEVVRELREQFGEDLPIVLMSHDRVDAIDRVAGLLLGADDYLAKPFAPDELMARVRRLIARSEPQPREAAQLKLTPREEEVLRLLARGLDQRAIAAELVISSKTVASHIQRILSKLGVHSRAQAVAAAHRSGFLASA